MERMIKIIEEFSNSVVTLKYKVEYLVYSDDYVEMSGFGFLHNLTVIETPEAREGKNFTEEKCGDLFFKKVEKLMSKQCDLAASSCNLRIKLNPIFRLSAFYPEDRKNDSNALRSVFIKFDEDFYKKVSMLRSTSEQLFQNRNRGNAG